MIACQLSSGGETGVGTDFRRLKGQNDAITRDATFHQNFGNGVRSAVVLDDDLTITNVYVQDSPMNVVSPIPACVNQFVMILRLVKDDLCPDISDRWLVL